MNINTTRQKLIEAFTSYNADTILKPDEFDDIDNTIGCAEEQVDEIINRLKK